MNWRLCVAPMMDWTDRHCRVYLRHVAPRARLYTEMVTTGALLHGDVPRHLDFDPAEHPLALQLGGSEPEDLAHCARLAAKWGYDEINLNIGCPSERVQRGAFGACLMAEPALVADCVRAMKDAAALPVTVKHRIGLGREESYAFVRDFVGTVSAAGCETFMVHARNAWLSGLSPKENREVPPLRYEVVRRLKQDFPHLRIVLNGGLSTLASIEAALRDLDGVMIGRAAYHDSWLLAQVDARLSGHDAPRHTRADVVRAMVDYATAQARHGVPLRAMARHLLGLFHGAPRARLWRRMLSDASRLARNDPALLREALEAVEGRFAVAA